MNFRFLFYFALGSAILAAVSSHALGLEGLLNAPGSITDTLPSSKVFLLCALIATAGGLLPRLVRRVRTSHDTRAPFVCVTLPEVARHIEEITSESKPDVPYIVDYAIFQAIASGASDIHFDPDRNGFTVRFRIDGMMNDICQIPALLTSPIINRLKVLSNLVVYQGFLPQDGRLGQGDDSTDAEEAARLREAAGADFRIAFMPTLHGERIVIRILGRSADDPELGQLGMTEAQQQTLTKLIAQPQGMIVLTGPTGSGKTTTIYAVLHTLQAQTKSERSIATLEDPIEYDISGVNQSQVDEKKGFSFEQGLRAILRQDPDVIMVGEIRDKQTAHTAVQAGMTGHLIITTVHANSTAATFSRLLEMGVEPFSLNSAVTAIVAQRLVRRVCPHCKVKRAPTGEDLSKMSLAGALPDFYVWRGTGCEACEGNGHQGRVAVFEILEVTEAIRELVAANGSSDAIYAEARKHGMTSLYQAGLDAVKRGTTTPEEIARVIAGERR